LHDTRQQFTPQCLRAVAESPIPNNSFHVDAKAFFEDAVLGGFVREKFFGEVTKIQFDLIG